MRAPRAVLIWVFGHSWSLNGFQRYAEPGMMLLPDRSRDQIVSKTYKRIHDGGRLKRATIEAAWPTLQTVFGDDALPFILDAIKRPARTLLIEGGGPPLMPDRSLGEAAYQRWRDLPEGERGFVARQK